MKKIFLVILSLILFVESFSQKNEVLSFSNYDVEVIFRGESYNDSNFFYLEIKALVDIIFLGGGDWIRDVEFQKCEQIFYINDNIMPDQNRYILLEKDSSIVIPYIRINCIPKTLNFTCYYALRRDIPSDLIILSKLINDEKPFRKVFPYSYKLQKAYRKVGKSLKFFSKLCFY